MLSVRERRDSIAYDQRCSCSSYARPGLFVEGAASAEAAAVARVAAVDAGDRDHRQSWRLEGTVPVAGKGCYGGWTASAPDYW